MNRDELYKEIEETLGGVGDFMDKMDDAMLDGVWDATKKTFLSEMSVGLKVNALIALGAAHALECQY